jgi:hypothetical protein
MRLFFLVLLLGMGYFAQAQLHGIVVDASTQLPLSHVHVEVHELNTEVITRRSFSTSPWSAIP